jgi:RhoGAP domain
VKLLPVVNYRCIQVILAHLIRVVQNCDKNKMNVRNISIVFSPTLGIPAGIFTLMMAEYPTVFEAGAPAVADLVPFRPPKLEAAASAPSSFAALPREPSTRKRFNLIANGIDIAKYI